MGEYSYIVGGFFGLFVFLIILGPLGGADDIYGDEFVVVDSEDYSEQELDDMQYDFDVQNILFTPDLGVDVYRSASLSETELINSSGNLNYSDDGKINAPLDEDAYLAYNVTDRDDLIALDYSMGTWRGPSIKFYVSGDTPENSTEDVIFEEEDGDNICYNRVASGASPVFIDLGNSSVPDDTCSGSVDENVETLLITFEPFTLGQDSRPFVDVSGGNYEYVEGESLLLQQFDSGVVGGLLHFLDDVVQIVIEFISMLKGYIDFTLAVPGLLGTILRGYALILVGTVILKEVWL